MKYHSRSTPTLALVHFILACFCALNFVIGIQNKQSPWLIAFNALWVVFNAALCSTHTLLYVMEGLVRHGRPRSTPGNTGSSTNGIAPTISIYPAAIGARRPEIPRSGARTNARLISMYKIGGGYKSYDDDAYYHSALGAFGGLPVTTSTECIIAYRVWRVRMLGEPRLQSSYESNLWKPAEPMKGRIDGDHPTRLTGVHAFANWEDAAACADGASGCGLSTVVIGTVSLWGKVIICETGYRAEFGYPKELVWTNGPADLLQDLARVYGLDVYLNRTEEVA